ncbi:MAG: hypothetical protein OEY39_02195 [Candidatus Bathyarchaeota archaeon]|nr:hypothetical protein [Candidatus Bathyarchaeota archaeon]
MTATFSGGLVAWSIHWPITSPKAIPKPAEKASLITIPRLFMVHVTTAA